MQNKLKWRIPTREKKGKEDLTKSEARLLKLIDKLNLALDKTNFKEYTDYMTDRKKVFLNSFLSGITRGLGAAVGFTVLGALVIFLISELNLLNAPVIGKYIARIVEMVNINLR